MKWLHNILEVFHEELHNALTDEGVIVFFLIVPLLYPLLYSYLYGKETVREVPTVVVDMAKSATSREFLRKVDATSDVYIVGHCADMQEAVEQVHRRNAYCLIYIPAEFDRDLVEGRQAVVELYSDMGSILYYKAVYASCTEVSLAMNRDIKAQRLEGATDEQASTFAYPIEYEYVPMFNTQSGFASFIIPGVLILVIQQTMLLGIGMMAGEEREKKRRGILEPHVIGKRPVEMFAGKGAAYLAIYVVIAAYVFCVVPRLFHLIQIGRWADMLAFLVPFLLACLFFSMTLSGLAYNREVFIIMFVFVSVPLLFISGISWPSCSVPAFWKVVSWFFPSTFGINGLVKINSMGAVLSDVRPELIGLWVQVVVYGITAWLVYYRSYGKHLRDIVEETQERLQARWAAYM
mgnify:FL=1